jgi:hypothetical protein
MALAQRAAVLTYGTTARMRAKFPPRAFCAETANSFWQRKEVVLSAVSDSSLTGMIHFLGIGAQKAGTTWLFEQLRKHPDIRFPAGKEVHFWDRQLDRGEAWWLSLFPGSAAQVRQGEITPAYAILDSARVSRIRKLAPGLRIFYSLRNPIERAWSSALMALARAEMTIDEASDRWFLDHFHSAGSLRRGAYNACLDTWFGVFPAEQLAVVFFDDIAADPWGVLRTVFAHIGVDDARFVNVDEGRLRRAVFAGTRARIRPALLASLRLMYESEITVLAQRLHRNLDGWLTWDGNGG